MAESVQLPPLRCVRQPTPSTEYLSFTFPHAGNECVFERFITTMNRRRRRRRRKERKRARKKRGKRRSASVFRSLLAVLWAPHPTLQVASPHLAVVLSQQS